MFNLIRSPSSRKRRSKTESMSSHQPLKHEPKSILLSNRPSDPNLSISAHHHHHHHQHHRHSELHPFSLQHQHQHQHQHHQQHQHQHQQHHQHQAQAQTHQSSIPISQLSPQQPSALLNQSTRSSPLSDRPQSSSSQSTRRQSTSSTTQRKSSLLNTNFIRSSKLCYSSDLAFSDPVNSNNNSLNNRQHLTNSDQAHQSNSNMQISSPISVTVGRDVNNLPRRPLQADPQHPVTLVRTPSEAVRKMMSSNARNDRDRHRSPPPPLPRTSSRNPQPMQSLTSPSRTFYSSPDLAARHLASNPKLYPVSQPLTQFPPSNSLPINLSNQSQDLQNESNHRPSSDQLQSQLRINPTRSSPLSDTISSYQAWISPTPVESEVDQIVPPGTAITTTTNSPRASPRNPRESMEQISNRVNVNHAFPSVSPPRHQLKPSFTPHKEMGKPPAVILRRRPLFSAPSRPDSANLDSSQTRPISSTVGSFVSSSFETFLPNFPDPPRSSMTSHRNEIPSSTAVQRTSLISIAGNPNSSNVIPTEPVLTEPEEFDSPTSYPTASLSPPTSLDLKPLPIIPSSKSFKAHLISDLPKLTTDPNPMIVSLNVGGQIFMTLLENVVSTPSYLNDFLIQRLGLNSPEIKSSDHSQWSLNSEHHGPTTTTITRNGVKNKEIDLKGSSSSSSSTSSSSSSSEEEEEEEEEHEKVEGPNEEDELTSKLSKKVNKLNQIEIFLDRDPCNYTKILNFWRFKSIEKLRFSEDESDLIEEANWIGLVELVSLMKSNKLEE